MESRIGKPNPALYLQPQQAAESRQAFVLVPALLSLPVRYPIVNLLKTMTGKD